MSNKAKQDESHEFYSRVVLCKKRGGRYVTHRYTLPLNTTPEELQVFLLETEGYKFNVEELLNTGELLTAKHRLSTHVEANSQGIKRTPITSVRFHTLMGLKYLLCKGLSYSNAVKVMRDYSPISEQDKSEFWEILTTDKDFLETVERIAYSQ